MLWPFSFKAECQNYNSLEMDEDGNILEKRFSGVKFQTFPILLRYAIIFVGLLAGEI